MLTGLFHFFFRHAPEDFAQGKWTFTSPLPGELRLLIAVAAIGAVVWVYRRGAAARKATARWLLGLRIAAVALLLFILGAPALHITRPDRNRLFTAVLVDTSQSMSIADVHDAPRLQAARRTLDETIPELSRLSQVIVYTFSDGIRRAAMDDLIDATGPRTDLFASIRAVDAELRNLPLGAVVLLTDGARNAGGGALDAAKILQARGTPLYVVGVGDPNPPRDLELVQVLAPATVPVGSQADVDVTVRHTGFTEPFDLILKRGEEIVLTRRITPETGSDLQRLRLTFTPDSQGAASYRIEIPPIEGDLIARNNARDFLIDCVDDRLPVLYVEGSPRMEYRFLRRALSRDPTFRLVGMLRLNTGRFYLQGAGPDEEYLKDGFPRTIEQLSAFKAIILGDVEARHFTATQQQLIEDFVKLRGGGLLMLGGVNSFGPGGYAGTPIGQALPVTMASGDGAYTDGQFTAQVAGPMDHPVMRLSLDETENKLLWDNAPPLIGVTPVRAVKPGATLLLRRPGSDNPVLAVQNYGQGRSAAFTSGGSWYWQVSRDSRDEFHEKFWKQLVRWLAVGAQDLLTVASDASVYSRNDPVTLTANVLGKDLRPLNDAQLTAVVTDPLGNTRQLPMDWILSREGVYQCRYVPEHLGQYRAAVHAQGWTDKPVEISFVVSDSTLEFADAAMKRDVLRDMASLTRGQYFDLENADALPQAVREGMRSAALTASAPEIKPLWDMPILLVIAIGLIASEWFLRRRSGLS